MALHILCSLLVEHVALSGVQRQREKLYPSYYCTSRATPAASEQQQVEILEDS
jgi:hypothetical protein